MKIRAILFTVQVECVLTFSHVKVHVCYAFYDVLRSENVRISPRFVAEYNVRNKKHFRKFILENSVNSAANNAANSVKKFKLGCVDSCLYSVYSRV